MARTPRYERAASPVSFRPRPANEDAINRIVALTGLTRSEVADEIITLGIPVFLRKKPELKEAVQAT
jgi:hypothetical protein